MKKLAITAFALVLMVSVLTGCGCTNSAAPAPTARPTTMPTTEAARPSVMPSETYNPTENTSAATEDSSMTEIPGTTETTPPMTKESGKVKSHVNGNF